MAVTGSRGSVPRSKRMLASVFSPSALLVRRTDCGVEIRALEDDRLVVGGDLGVAAAHDAGDRDRHARRRQ